MTAPVLADALGPRARRRMALATLVSGLGLAALAAVAVGRLADEGQLRGELWRPFTDGRVVRFLLLGLVATLKGAALAMVLALAIGGAMALGRLARNGPVRWLSGAYVEVFRALPLLLLIYFSARGLPRLGVGLVGAFWYLVMALVAYNSAVLAEIFRAGILSLERGQSEAAYAIGLSYWQSMLLVVVPQATRRMVPAMVSQLVTLLKDSSLGFVIPYEEFTRRGTLVGESAKNPLQSLFVVAVVYVAVNLTLSRLARRLELRQRRRYRAGAISVAGAEDVTALEADAGVRGRP